MARLSVRCAGLGVATLLGVAVPRSSALAQAADQRVVIETLRDSLSQLVDSVSLRALELRLIGDARQRRNDGLLHLRLGFIALRLGELAGRQHYEDAGSEFQWVTELHPRWPYGWLGLGLAELGVGDSEVALVQGLQSMLGKDALVRSANAFARSAEVDPEFVAGLVELTNTSLRQRINARLDVALAALRRAGQTQAARNPDVLLARGRIEREVGSLDSAMAAIDTLVAIRPRAGEAHLQLARIRFAMGRIDGTVPWFRGAASADAATVAAYRADLVMVMPDSTMRAFEVATMGERVALLRRFWETRDRDELHGSGERLREHYHRLDHARHNFRLVSANRQFDIAERYRSGQSEFDDRGVIYVRHGAPDARSSFAAPGMEANETWRYRRDGEPLLFHFVARQDVQDYRLVESLFDVLGFAATVRLRDGGDSINRSQQVEALLRSRENIHPVYSRLLAAGRGGGAQIQTEERSVGRRSIALGTRADSWRLQFDDPLAARVEIAAVGADANGPSVQVAFAVPGSSLRAVHAPQGVVYPVRMRATVLALDGRTVAAIDTLRTFVTRSEIPAREHLLGRVALRVPPGTYTIRVALESNRAGMVTARDTIRVASPDGPAIGLSDLAIGTRAVNLPWRTVGSDTAWANPLGLFRREQGLELYYELAGLAAGTPYRTDISVRRPKGGSVFRRVLGGGGAAIKFGFDGIHPGGLEAVRREVNLAELKPGTYFIEVVVSTRDGRTAVRQRALTVVP